MDQQSALSQKTVVLTGATSGIGLETAVQLCRAGAFIIATGRSQERCKSAEETVKKAYPDAKITFLSADLSSLRQIFRLSADIRDTLLLHGLGHIDSLINNAGTVSSWYVSTEDGFELQFAVNHLAPFLLTHELMPLLSASGAGRVITVSSGSHFRTRINWKDILLRRHYHILRAYKQSKLANVLFCTELNRRLGRKTVTAFAADPGLVNTQIGRKGTTGIARWIWEKRASGGAAPWLAANCLVYLAGEPSIQHSENVYWKECMPLRPSRYSQRADQAGRLWALSEKMCGISSADYGIGADKRTNG